ncbi:MAG: valine--tRNA ligase [Candidatus Verstraetearchaeota archaeon]|nr:valine--tRNA ligase [Candidatus Verstraetearchaeota archaeon]
MSKAEAETESRKMEKVYSPRSVEEKWQRAWLTEEFYQIYKFKNDGRPVFTIDTPPPFTSGELHMGHAYWNVINDTIARYKRMRGYDVILPQGWDCQGLPTELKVQYKWKIPREDRALFRKKCEEWTSVMIESMKRTMIRLGYRPDWEQFEYRTMDRSYWRAVQESLLQMHEKGLVYRKEFPIQWCSKCGTALAQAELGYIQREGKLYHLRFRTDAGDLVVATTRPELLNACQAIAMNPDDSRYSWALGREAIVPIFGNRVKVLADKAVDMNFGTGVVMICTYGDEQDIKWQQVYSLPVTPSVDEQGRMVNAGKYTGMKVLQAREEIAKDLESNGDLLKTENIVHNVLAHTERADCMTPIEFITKYQWFIKSKEFMGAVLEEAGKMKWFPEFMHSRLVDWINSIEWDWLISRQRVFGTPIPFWHCARCNAVIPPRKEDLPLETSVARPPVDRCPECGSEEIAGTSDVCDCWVDSSITPLFVTGYFKDRKLFERAYPADLRQQGHDIIRTWMYYSILRCAILTGRGPFKGALINGHILGPDGSRMSKSKGNVIVPEQGINQYGADAIRQALFSLTIGSDFPFKWEPAKYGKSFLQKLWSSARFAEGFFREGFVEAEITPESMDDTDKWIVSRLRETIVKVQNAMECFQFHTAVDLLQKFYWHDFCDQYIEAVKPRLYSPRRPEDVEVAKSVLYRVIWDFIRLLAPICPHITEEIYQKLFRESKKFVSVHGAPWPNPAELPEADVSKGEKVVAMISLLRSKKVEMKMALPEPVRTAVIYGNSEEIMAYKDNDWLIREVLHIGRIEYKIGARDAELIR